MERKKVISGIGAALGILVLILDGKTAIAGAQEGIELCIRTVIPSLFPFFLLSALLTGALGGLQTTLLRPLGRLCRIPRGSEGILLTGFLGGYPVGAQAVAQSYAAGQLTKSQANRMLAFCSNAGPSFLFGIIAGAFPSLRFAWLLWGIHLLSAVMVSIALPAGDLTSVKITQGQAPTLPTAMRSSLCVTANVCGWVILFRVLISFLNRWLFWALPIPVQVLLSGILELTNGCCMLIRIEHVGLRFLLCAGMLTFGGLCVTMQTVSVTAGLNGKSYLMGKLLQTLFCVFLALGCQIFFPAEMRLTVSPLWLPPAAIAILIMNAKRQKNSSNPVTVGV